MTLTFHWFLPTNGDSRDIVGGGHGVPTGSAGGARPASVAYLGQIARTAEQLGFVGALTPTGAWCEDAWLSTAMLTEVTERLKFLVAFRPGLTSPTLAAQMASTFQRLSRGRLLLNVVTGGESSEQRAYGDFLDKDDRYARADEFLHVVRALWRGETVDHDGTHVRVEQARLHRLPDPVPPVYFGGSSAAALPVAVRHSDVYLTWGEPPALVATKLERIRALAADAGRELRFGIRLHVIVRDTAEQAWAQAQRLLDGISRPTSGPCRRVAPQRVRRAAPHARPARRLPRRPGGRTQPVGRGRAGPRRAGTALVGSHTEVADRIAEYHALGIDEFILSGYPHLEEAYWFGEGVLPILRARGLWQHPTASRDRRPRRHPLHRRAGAAARRGPLTGRLRLTGDCPGHQCRQGQEVGAAADRNALSVARPDSPRRPVSTSSGVAPPLSPPSSKVNAHTRSRTSAATRRPRRRWRGESGVDQRSQHDRGHDAEREALTMVAMMAYQPNVVSRRSTASPTTVIWTTPIDTAVTLQRPHRATRAGQT
ncbi:LLM class flavin-dependent oxidoreductase [Micromonospora sp. M12]